jgi:hypothetical protein
MRAGSLSFLLLSLAIPPPAPAVLPPGWPAYASAVVAADGSVPYEQSVRMQKVLRESEVECDLITVPDGTHGTREWDERLPGYADQVVAWLAGRMKR